MTRKLWLTAPRRWRIRRRAGPRRPPPLGGFASRRGLGGVGTHVGIAERVVGWSARNVAAFEQAFAQEWKFLQTDSIPAARFEVRVDRKRSVRLVGLDSLEAKHARSFSISESCEHELRSRPFHVSPSVTFLVTNDGYIPARIRAPAGSAFPNGERGRRSRRRSPWGGVSRKRYPAR